MKRKIEICMVHTQDMRSVYIHQAWHEVHSCAVCIGYPQGRGWGLGERGNKCQVSKDNARRFTVSQFHSEYIQNKLKLKLSLQITDYRLQITGFFC